MHKSMIERLLIAAERAFFHELRIIEEILGHPHPRYRHFHPREHGEILFEFTFSNLQILQPMQVTKVIGAFSGSLVFKDAEGDSLDISNIKGLTLSGSDDTVGTVTLDPSTGKFTGSGLKAGDLVLTASGTNDAGNQVSGTSTISFHADTTVTGIDVNID